MIHQVEELKRTEQSFPFSEAEEKCALNERGYEEKEYLFSGTASVYRTVKGDEVEPVWKDVSYTNRMIIRRPRDPARFSGKVVVEITNATGRWDIERMWIISQRYFVNHGIIYVGLTSKPDVFDSLVRFDKERYGRINWPNPRPADQWKKPDLGLIGMPQYVREDQECGLFWDMLTDVADLLRGGRNRDKDNCISLAGQDGSVQNPLAEQDGSAQNPLALYKVNYVCLTGWSQSAGYLTRYVNSFAYRDRANRKHPVYDGYFNAGPVYIGGIPANQEEYALAEGPQLAWVHHVEEPFVIVQTESEVTAFGTETVPRCDSDEPGRLCRVYEIPGATHDTRYSLVDYYETDSSVVKAGVKPEYEGIHAYANNYPYDFPMNAAYDHFFRWVETKTAPPRLPRIETVASQESVKDALGNAKGGMRSVFIDLPTCRYRVCSTMKDGRKNPLFGYEEPYSAALLKELYGTLEHYRELAQKLTERHVRQGYVLEEDAQLLVEEAVKLAKERGLE